MCYYADGRGVEDFQRGSGAVSALVNFILYRMAVLKKTRSQVADDGEITRQSLTYILNKKGKKDIRPEPETIRGIAKGLEVHPSVLTSLMGYSVEPVPDIDERLYEMAHRLLGAPWLAERIDELLALSRDEFDEAMDRLEYRQYLQEKRQARQRQNLPKKRQKKDPLVNPLDPPDRNGSQSNQ